jgi:ribosome-associated protein
MALVISSSLSLPSHLIEERFVRGSGPGGQNVNKVATAVELGFDIGRSPLAEDVRMRLRRLAGARVTDADVLVIDAHEHRTQAQNREAARNRLVDLIRRALRRPRRRRATRPTAVSRERRLESKHRRSSIKKGRQRARDD